MQVSNPLVPPSPGQPGAAPAPVANAPSVPDATQHQTPRSISAGRESDRRRDETERRPEEPSPDYRAGDRVDIEV